MGSGGRALSTGCPESVGSMSLHSNDVWPPGRGLVGVGGTGASALGDSQQCLWTRLRGEHRTEGKGQCANTQTFTPPWCRRAQGLGTFLGNKWEKAFRHQYADVTGGLGKTMFEIKMLSSL